MRLMSSAKKPEIEFLYQEAIVLISSRLRRNKNQVSAFMRLKWEERLFLIK